MISPDYMYMANCLLILGIECFNRGMIWIPYCYNRNFWVMHLRWDRDRCMQLLKREFPKGHQYIVINISVVVWGNVLSYVWGYSLDGIANVTKSLFNLLTGTVLTAFRSGFEIWYSTDITNVIILLEIRHFRYYWPFVAFPIEFITFSAHPAYPQIHETQEYRLTAQPRATIASTI